jgi:hypothetical protein
VDAAVTALAEKGVRQPTLFKCSNTYYVKADDTAICLKDSTCFANAVELTFMLFHVFNVEYPQELKLFYGLIEHMLGMKRQFKSSTLSNVIRTLSAAC